MQTKFLVYMTIVSLVNGEINNLMDYRERRCCKYIDQESHCHDQDSCVLIHKSYDVIQSVPGNDNCSVLVDTKKQFPDIEGKSQCFDQTYSLESFFDSPPPFLLKPYVFSENTKNQMPNSQFFPAVEVFIKWNYGWKSARFRIVNTKNCDLYGDTIQQSDPTCFPRCVRINRPIPEIRDVSNEDVYLGYDCEVGFSRSVTGSLISQDGNTYVLDICLTDEADEADEETCGSYFFRMLTLDQSQIRDEILFIDRYELLYNNKVIVHGDDGFKNETTYGVFKKVDQGPDVFIQEVKLGETFTRLDSGKYAVKVRRVGEWFELAMFFVPLVSFVRVLLLFVILFTAIFAILFVYLYRRYVYVKNCEMVIPNQLVEDGKKKAKQILIISNVDNKAHVEIILAFSTYLKVSTNIIYIILLLILS